MNEGKDRTDKWLEKKEESIRRVVKTKKGARNVAAKNHSDGFENQKVQKTGEEEAYLNKKEYEEIMAGRCNLI